MSREDVLDLVQRAAKGDKGVHVGACRILLDEIRRSEDEAAGKPRMVTDELAARRTG